MVGRRSSALLLALALAIGSCQLCSAYVAPAPAPGPEQGGGRVFQASTAPVDGAILLFTNLGLLPNANQQETTFFLPTNDAIIQFAAQLGIPPQPDVTATVQALLDGRQKTVQQIVSIFLYQTSTAAGALVQEDLPDWKDGLPTLLGSYVLKFNAEGTQVFTSGGQQASIVGHGPSLNLIAVDQVLLPTELPRVPTTSVSDAVRIIQNSS